ncbi:MAG: 4Fe-4S binding protein [Pseudomonadota bacterium]
MSDTPRVMICNCEGSMALDGGAIGEALDLGNLKVHTNLCRRDLAAFQDAATEQGRLIVACTQEAPLFSELVDENGFTASTEFTNIRERAGWTSERKGANEKIAALIAEAMHVVEPPRLRSITSDGLCLIYGRGQEALEAAKLLSPRLSVTLVLESASDVLLPSVLDFPIFKGRLKSVSGSMGGFDVVVDEYAPMLPSSRSGPEFVMAKDGAKSRCSLVLDLSGGVPLVTGHHKRDGYVRVDPGDPAAVMRAIFDLGDLVGEFEKPIYVNYDPSICAHSRNMKTGCSKCLDVCPAGAISPDGDLVHYDTAICGGCGSCHAVCPTGAVSYAYPGRSEMLERLFTLSETFVRAGGGKPVLLIHDEAFGDPLITASARFGQGLPANTIPFLVHSPTVFGHTEMMAAFVAGFSALVVLTDPKKADEVAGLESEAELARAILSGLGTSGEIVITQDPDPDALETQLYGLSLQSRKPHRFEASGGKRTITRMAITELARESGASAPIALPTNAPYGRVMIDQEACTLCMSCVSACPADAMHDTPGEPRLRFTEQACVQCSLCVKTCPENALSLEPRLDWTPAAMQPITLYEEEPFECISCGTPFATKSTIERVSEKLAGKHWMFEGDERAELLKMCGDCRIEAQASGGRDPFAVGERPRPRTTDDYIESEKKSLSIDDFLMN